MEFARASGLLLHISSLPSPYGIGDLGPPAYRFVDACARSGQTFWQMLPVCPAGHGYSPYASPASFAGNPLLISPDLLVSDGWLSEYDLTDVPDWPADRVDFSTVHEYKRRLLMLAFSKFLKWSWQSNLEAFIAKQQDWVLGYAGFCALKEKYANRVWTKWPEKEARMLSHAQSLQDLEDQATLYFHLFEQYVFQQQWMRLRTYCHKHGIRIIGDLPIYVAHDSVDVWRNPEQFQLDESGEPTVVGGVPPDLFSQTGQRWGNPIYRWDEMARDGFTWWKRRMKRALELFDIVRLDHFRGFAGYWEIPASAPTAQTGRWIEGPQGALFESLKHTLSELPFIAEDLGVDSTTMRQIMHQYRFPGMVVLQFGFDSDHQNPHLPDNYRPNQIAYTGTHDNDTLSGWMQTSPECVRAFVRSYLNLIRDEDFPLVALQKVMESPANLVITPVQDVLSLGSEARMNTPGTVDGNWQWRLTSDQMEALEHNSGRHLHTLTRGTERLR